MRRHIVFPYDSNYAVDEPIDIVGVKHGHSILTMLTVYAAWVQDAAPIDRAAIRRSLHNRPQRMRVNMRSTRSRSADSAKKLSSDLAVDLAVTRGP